MGPFLRYLDGRKVYLLSGALVVGVLVLVFLGRLDPTTGVTFAVGASFAFAFRRTLQKHHDQVLSLLTDVGSAGAAARAHNKQAEIDSLMRAAEQGAALANEAVKEGDA
jgi:hypothetical protein